LMSALKSENGKITNGSFVKAEYQHSLNYLCAPFV